MVKSEFLSGFNTKYSETFDLQTSWDREFVKRAFAAFVAIDVHTKDIFGGLEAGVFMGSASQFLYTGFILEFLAGDKCTPERGTHFKRIGNIGEKLLALPEAELNTEKRKYGKQLLLILRGKK